MAKVTNGPSLLSHSNFLGELFCTPPNDDFLTLFSEIDGVEKIQSTLGMFGMPHYIKELHRLIHPLEKIIRNKEAMGEDPLPGLFQHKNAKKLLKKGPKLMQKWNEIQEFSKSQEDPNQAAVEMIQKFDQHDETFDGYLIKISEDEKTHAIVETFDNGIDKETIKGSDLKEIKSKEDQLAHLIKEREAFGLDTPPSFIEIPGIETEKVEVPSSHQSPVGLEMEDFSRREAELLHELNEEKKVQSVGRQNFSYILSEILKFPLHFNQLMIQNFTSI